MLFGRSELATHDPEDKGMGRIFADIHRGVAGLWHRIKDHCELLVGVVKRHIVAEAIKEDIWEQASRQILTDMYDWFWFQGFVSGPRNKIILKAGPDGVIPIDIKAVFVDIIGKFHLYLRQVECQRGAGY